MDLPQYRQKNSLTLFTFIGYTALAILRNPFLKSPSGMDSRPGLQP